jgi:hypothetical protein
LCAWHHPLKNVRHSAKHSRLSHRPNFSVVGPPFEAASCHALRNSPGSLAKFAAILRASSFVRNLAADSSPQIASSHTHSQPPSSPLCQLECGRSELFDELVPWEVGIQVSEAANAYCTQPVSTDVSATIEMSFFTDWPPLFCLFKSPNSIHSDGLNFVAKDNLPRVKRQCVT